MGREERSDSASRIHGEHAVVIGGSIAAMMAAKILRRSFERVTLVERDQLPEGDAHRAGAPQARHLHFLLKRGLMVIEELFPGATADLLAAGSHLIDQGRDFRILYRSGWAPPVPCHLELCACTRPLLESTMRRHLLLDPAVHLIEGYEVTGLAGDTAGTGIGGVRIRARTRLHEQREETLLADFVVDASGCNSHVSEWLARLGYPAPEETVVDAFWGYATRLYEPPAGFRADWKSLMIFNRPPDQPRAGIIQPVEGNRWIVTLAGVMEDYPPTDEAGFLDFASTLSSPLLYEAIQQARPLSRIWGFRRTENRLRRFSHLSRQPERFVALGDAVCSFNPVYALGMTLAGLSVLELDRCLAEAARRHSLLGLAHRFQRRLARLVASSWALTTGEDLRWPATQGGRITLKTRFMHWYIDQVVRLIPSHEGVFRRFQEVNHMLKPAGALFHPAMLLPVLRQALLPGRSTGTAAWLPEDVPGRVEEAA